MSVWTIVVAAGTGERFGRPKQFAALTRNERLVDYAVRIAASVSDGVVCVLPPGDGADAPQGVVAVAGGQTRSDSVRNGLRAVPETAEYILVHDAARPLASPTLFTAVINHLKDGDDAVIPGMPVKDTIKRVTYADVDRAYVDATVAREDLVAVQTPQGFRGSVLRSVHATEQTGTDDALLVEQHGGKVVVIPGELSNIKVTYPEDLDYVRERAE